MDDIHENLKHEKTALENRLVALLQNRKAVKGVLADIDHIIQLERVACHQFLRSASHEPNQDPD